MPLIIIIIIIIIIMWQITNNVKQTFCNDILHDNLTPRQCEHPAKKVLPMSVEN